jgi:hypothetical protein
MKLPKRYDQYYAPAIEATPAEACSLSSATQPVRMWLGVLQCRRCQYNILGLDVVGEE